MTSKQITAALLARLKKLNAISDFGYITVTVCGDINDDPKIEYSVSTRHTELSKSSDLDRAIDYELAKHSDHKARKSEIEKKRKKAAELLEEASKLEASELALPTLDPSAA